MIRPCGRKGRRSELDEGARCEAGPDGRRRWWCSPRSACGLVVWWTEGGWAATIVYELGGYGVGVVALVAIARHRPAARAGRGSCSILGILGSATGDLLWDLTERLSDVPGYTSMVANLAYLASYPLFVVGVLGLLGSRGDATRRGRCSSRRPTLAARGLARALGARRAPEARRRWAHVLGLGADGALSAARPARDRRGVAARPRERPPVGAVAAAHGRRS